MKWVNKLPTKPGWYWYRNLARKYEEAIPSVVCVRTYGGDLAVGNCTIDCPSYSTAEWSDEPITLPEEP